MSGLKFDFVQEDWQQPRLVNLSPIDNDMACDDSPFTIRFDGQLEYTHHGGGSKGTCAECTTFSGISVNDDTANVIIPEQTGSETDWAGTQSQFFTISVTSEPVEPVYIPIVSPDKGECVTCWLRANCPDRTSSSTPGAPNVCGPHLIWIESRAGGTVLQCKKALLEAYGIMQ